MHFSKVEKKESDQSRMDFFHIENQYILFLSDRDKNEVIVHIYDSLLHHKSRSVLDLGGQLPLKITLINNVPVLFSKITNSKGEQELYSHNVSTNGLLSSTLLITKYKNYGSNVIKYKIAISENSKHIIVLVVHPFEKDKHEKITILTLGQDFNIKKKHEYTLDLISKHKSKNVTIVTNNGMFYLLKRYWDKGNKYYLGLQKGSDFLETELKLRNRKIADLRYAISPDDKLLLCGFFTSPIRFNFEGVFTFRFNNSINPEYRKESFFTENIISAFKHKKEIKDKGFGLDHFKAKNVLLDTLGCQYLIAEHHFIEKTKNGSVHNRKGVVIFKFTKSGNYIWGVPVITDQKEQNKISKWTSSVPFVINSNFYFMYNNISNEKANKIDHTYGPSTLHGTNIVKFDQKGEVLNQPIFGMHEGSGVRLSFRPKILLQEEQDIYFITENSERNNFRIVRMNFQ